MKKTKLIINYMEILGKLFLFIIAIVLGFFVSLLGTQVILSVATLYKLTFITQFSFIQIYGVLCIWGLITYKHQKDEENKEDNWFSTLFEGIFSKIFFLLIVWGFSFLTYSILT